MDAWGDVGSHRPCGSPTLPEAFFAFCLPLARHLTYVAPSYIWKPMQGMSTIHSVKSSPFRSSPLSAVVLFLGCASGGVVPVGRGARQAASTQCTPLHSTLAAAPTFNPASLTKAVLKVSPLLTMSLPLFPRLVFGQSHGRPVFPLTLRLTDNFKIWIVAKSYSFTSFSFFLEILQVYPFFFFFLGALCIALLNFMQDSNSP